MGTHPIFESDFDCLTECFLESLHQLPAFRLDLPDTVSPSLILGSVIPFQLSPPCSSMPNSLVLSALTRSMLDGNTSLSSPKLLLQKPTRKKKKKMTNKYFALSKLFALKYH